MDDIAVRRAPDWRFFPQKQSQFFFWGLYRQTAAITTALHGGAMDITQHDIP